MTTEACPHGHGCYFCHRAEQRRIQEEADKDTAGFMVALAGFATLLMTLTVYFVYGLGLPYGEGCGWAFERCGAAGSLYILAGCAGVSLAMMALGVFMDLRRRRDKRRAAAAL